MKKLAASCNILFILALLVTGFGCGPAPGSGEERSGKTGSGSARTARFDPLDMDADETIVPKEFPRVGTVNGTVLVNQDELLSTADSTSEFITAVPNQIDSLLSQAYRIQIFTTKVYGDARHALKVAEEIFDRSVSVDYEVPYFKVRIGRFADRDEAVKYANRAKAAGYKDAWVVMVNTSVKKASSLYDNEFPLFQFEDSTSQVEQNGGEESDEDTDD